MYFWSDFLNKSNNVLDATANKAAAFVAFFKFLAIFAVNVLLLSNSLATLPPVFFALIPAFAVSSNAPPKLKNFENSSPPTFLSIPSIPLTNFPVSPIILLLNLASSLS